MKKILYVSFLLASVVSQAWAQEDIDSRLDSELKRVYDTEDSVTRLKKTKSATGSNIYIYNNQDQNAKQNALHDQQSVQDQPTTLVEASPLIDSESSKIRNARKQMEIQTEEKIVEKLEYSRIEDEKKRADKLFGSRLDNISSDDCNDPCASKIDVCSKKCVKDEVKEVVIVKSDSSKYQLSEIEAQETITAKNYIMGIVGIQDYHGVKNVQNATAFGLGIGMGFSSNFALEGSLVYSQADLEDQSRRIVSRGLRSRAISAFPNVKVDQLMATAALKYVLSWNRIKPFVGGTLGAAYRMYQDEFEVANSTVGNTVSLDAGVTAGVDIAITNNFSLGCDFRYARNISNNRDSNTIDSFQGSRAQPLEEMAYQSALLNAKFNF